jgi:photosystem II stability/assembly factor-like uncharacterized protein
MRTLLSLISAAFWVANPAFLPGQAAKVSKLVQIGAQPGGDSLVFVSASEGWVYDRGAIWQTRDGGTTWTRVAFPLPRGTGDIPPGLISLHLESANAGWIWVDNSKDYPSIVEEQSVYRTSDGGRTWVEEPASPLAKVGSQHALFYLPGGSIGWQGGVQPVASGAAPGDLAKCRPWWDGRPAKPVVFHTTDAGASWSEQALPKSSGCNVSALSFRNPQEGIAITEHEVYHTADGGANWLLSEFLTCCTDADWHSVFSMPPASAFLLDGTAGWLSYEDGYLFKTVDGGASWRQLAHPGQIWAEQKGLGNFGVLYFSSAQRGWILGGDRSVYETADGGSSWSKLAAPDPVIALSCATSGGCWALSERRLYRIELR